MKAIKSSSAQFFLTVLLPLIAGVLVYLFFSPSPRYFFRFFPEPTIHFPQWNWIAFSLPDGLWTFSFVSFIGLIFHEKNLRRTLFIFLALLAGPLLELFQYVRCIPGTFDAIDILFQIISGTLAICCTKLFSNKKEFYVHRFKTTFSILGCIAFLVMAFANSPTKPPRLTRAITIVNHTGKPVNIIEEGSINFKLDSGTGNFLSELYDVDSGYYFIFAYNDVSRYPGILNNGIKKATRKEITDWKKYNLKSFDYSRDQTLLVPESRRICFRRNSEGMVDSVSFWLMPDYDYTFTTTIPLSDSANFEPKDFPSYKIFFTNKNGTPDSLKLRGREFYKYIDKSGNFEIK